MQSNSTASPSTSKPAPTSNARRQPGVRPPKPAKPYPDFPLYAHASGRWAKKIRGVLKYFGPWNDPDGALATYLDRKNDLHAGRTPRADAGELTVKDLVNAFLNSKQNSVDAGELKQRTWNTYKETTDFMIGEFGKRRLVEDIGPSDFASMRRKMAKRWGLHRLANHIQYTRSVFKFGVEEGLIVKAVRYGTGFKKPSKKNFRIEKSKQEIKLFTADEIRRMLATATPSMKAMILLGVNCGFGNADCALLPTRAVDLQAGWINFPRPKTGLDRRCPLWPETVAAIREWLPVRPGAEG